MKPSKKNTEKASKLSTQLPAGTRVKFWTGGKIETPKEGTVVSPFYVADNNVVCVSIKSVGPVSRTHWMVAATHVERAA